MSQKPTDGQFDYAILDAAREVIGEAFGRTSPTNIPPAEANARLMAAAPILLDALNKSVANHCPNDKLFCSTCSPARETIATIEGQ